MRIFDREKDNSIRKTDFIGPRLDRNSKTNRFTYVDSFWQAAKSDQGREIAQNYLASFRRQFINVHAEFFG